MHPSVAAEMTKRLDDATFRREAAGDDFAIDL